MSLRHWGSESKSKRGKDNTDVRAKFALRKWIAMQIAVQSVFEAFGPGGLGTEHWRNLGATEFGGTPEGEDANQYVARVARTDWNVWDIDPWGNPFTALRVIAQRATADVFGAFLTDGALYKMSQIGGHLPREAMELLGYPAGVGKETRTVKRWIYYHYPEALRSLVGRLLEPRYKVRAMRVVRARGSHAACYAAVIAQSSVG